MADKNYSEEDVQRRRQDVGASGNQTRDAYYDVARRFGGDQGGRQIAEMATAKQRGQLTTYDVDMMAPQYGGGLRGDAGDRYRYLGGLAEAADNRNIAMSENEAQARLQMGLARRQQMDAANEYRAAALGMRPSLAQAQAGREQAMIGGGLVGMGANTKGPNMALGQGLAMTAGANAMAERAGQAADQYAQERQRAMSGWSQGAGQMRGADNQLYGMEIDRAMQQRAMNDDRTMQLMGMQETMAERERRGRMRMVDMELQKYQQDNARAQAASDAAKARETANRNLMIGVAAGAVTGGAGAAVGGGTGAAVGAGAGYAGGKR